MSKTIGIYVNTEQAMPEDMLRALTRFEFQCVLTSQKTTTTAAVKDFLLSEYGPEMADAFKPKFMVQDS